MIALKRKIGLPLFWVTLLFDVLLAFVLIALAASADELVIVGYQGYKAVLILSGMAAFIVSILSLVGIVMRPSDLTRDEYFWKKDW
jgi:hypothetical protein